MESLPAVATRGKEGERDRPKLLLAGTWRDDSVTSVVWKLWWLQQNKKINREDSSSEDVWMQTPDVSAITANPLIHLCTLMLCAAAAAAGISQV